MSLIGAHLRRPGDTRLLTGGGRYVADIPLPDAAAAAVLRSPYAHAHIAGIDTAAALALPGVVAVVTAADLGAANRPFPMIRPHPGLTHPATACALADTVVRYVGEPVAVVVAEDRYIAEDALERIAIEYEPLPAATDLEAALYAGAPQVHPSAPGNLAGQDALATGDIKAAFAAATHVFTQQLRIARGSAQPMETRAVAAEYEQGRLTVWSSTQRPHRLRRILAESLDLPAEQIRAVAPDVGGGFGPKGNFYSEELLVPWLALRLQRPVRWVEDRREHFLSVLQDRLQIYDVAVAVDADGRLLGLSVDFLHDHGAYTPYGFVVPVNVSTHLVGPYRIPAVAISWRGVYTHRTPTGSYRGAGRPQGVFVIERTLDLVARQLGLDPAEVRRRNLIPAAALPHDTGMPFGKSSLVYDSGDYPACQAAALEHLPYDHWRAEQARLRAQGRHIGIGLANYVEVCSTQETEGGRVDITAGGEAVVYTGIGDQGQGQHTTLAQIAAATLDLPITSVRAEMGDTNHLEQSIGTFGSRTTVLAGNAVREAAVRVRAQALQQAAALLEVAETELEWLGTAVAVRDTPSRRCTLADLAAAADAQGTPLTATHVFRGEPAHVANGTHAAVVELDPDTGRVIFHRYVVVHDCGAVINPMLVDGQVCGGAAQGISGSLYERLVHDETGQLVTASLMDYLLPTATEVPSLELHHMESPSPHNPLGVKGAGEGGALPPHAVIAAAVEDALGVPVRELPLTPDRIRALFQTASCLESER